MSYSSFSITIIVIYGLIQVGLPNKRRSNIDQPCLKESDCNKTGYIDCFCIPPLCLCYTLDEPDEVNVVFNATGLEYGEKCTTNDDCRYVFCHPISKTCLCYYRYHRENDKCVEGHLGYPCSDQCPWVTYCDPAIGYKCRCYDNSYQKPNDSIYCHQKLLVGENCILDAACYLPAKCKNGKCDCNYKEHFQVDGKCISKLKLGEKCERNDYCINHVCSDKICVCPYGYQEIHGICTQNLFNITCQTDNDCLEKMNYTMCDIQKKLCTCNLKTYRGNETCIPKKQIGKFCNENVQCLYDYCKDFICTCRYGYYLFGEDCTEGKKPGAECYLDEECQSLNNHSSCVNRFCQCSPKFHLEKKKYCIPVISNYASCAFKTRIDMSRILNTAQYLSISWYQISKDIEQKAADVYQTKLSDTFISITAYAGEQDGIVEALIYFRLIIDDISLNLSELLLDKVELFEPIPFLPELDEVKIIALEGICMKPKSLISYEIKIGIVITTCLLFLTMCVVIGIIWYHKNNPKKYIPWVQTEFRKCVYIPPSGDLKEIVCILLEDELIIKNTDKVLSYKELQAIYIRYFYYSYYDFDYSYIYDMSYPYETYMINIEENFNYEGSHFDELDYMVLSNGDYNYISQDEYDKSYNYETDVENNI